MDLSNERIGFIGGGNMAFAIGSGLISRKIIQANQVIVSGPHLENLDKWKNLGTAVTQHNVEVVEKSNIIFICVKPQQIQMCAHQISDVVSKHSRIDDKVFVSVLAGVTLSTLEEEFKFIKSVKMIRSMPNTPMQVCEGCTVYSAGTNVTENDLQKVHVLFAALGVAYLVAEPMIAAVGPVTGCGPAFVYTIIEALADASVKLGVPRPMAIQCAAQTLLGASKTVLQTGRHPAVLRDEVCSPGGSTIVGVHELERGGLRNTLINAVEKAAQRTAEMGKKI